MYFIDEFQKGDETFDSCVLITEVNLDELENNKVHLLLKPYDENIKIARKWYHKDETFEGFQIIEYFRLTIVYDNVHDRIELFLKSSFDKFIYSICKFLNIGRITLYNLNVEDIERNEDVSSISENHVRSIVLSLDEFKRLDGFCGLIDVSGLSVVYFKGLQMSVNSLKKSVCVDFKRPDGRKEYLLRGEKLFKWID